MRRPPETSIHRQSRRPSQGARLPRQVHRSSAPPRLSLGDLVALLHQRALDRGLSEADAAALTARGVAAALKQSANRRLIDQLCQA
jgi:hypothetical protein